MPGLLFFVAPIEGFIIRKDEITPWQGYVSQEGHKMPHRSTNLRLLITKLILTAFVWHYLCLPATVRAQKVGSLAGQLVFARQVTINGANATPGQTVFSDNRIVTSDQGMAIINLGAYGRIEIGANTELILRLSESSIGGTLISGCMQASAPVNVAVSIGSGKGAVTSDSKQPASLTFGFEREQMRIISDMGEALVTSGANSKVLKAGEYVSVNTNSGAEIISNPRFANECSPRREEPRGLICSCRATSLARNAAKSAAPIALSATPLTLLGMLGAVATVTTIMMTTGTSSSSLTCVDGSGLPCLSSSPIR
jgi:hypothetical protein